jgi:RNA recognition motif-containing protein
MSINPSSATPGIPGSQRLNRLWIGGLPRNVSIDDVRAEVNRIYSAFGHVADVCVITTARDVMCFVQYEDEEVAYRAREETNGKMILGSVIKVNYAVVRGPDAPRQAAFRPGGPTAKSPSPERVKDPYRKVFVLGNVPDSMSLDDLRSVIMLAGEDLAFVNTWNEGDATFAIVSYDSSREARKARNRLHGAIVEGSKRKLEAFTVDEYNQMMKRKRSPSRERRRGGSRRRSASRERRRR